ncbi:MAG: AAA family ATPase [Pseudanabaena sp.]
MLIQFTIENFLSFRDEVTFSMVAVNSDSQHSEHLAQHEAGEGRSVLPIAAIYGANAAGKSNLIKAIAFAQNLVLEGTRSNQTIAINAFKLGDRSKNSSKFEFIFTYKGSQYSYGFTLNREQILEEWLYGIPQGKKKEIMYFERFTSIQDSNATKTTIKFGSIIKGKTRKDEQNLNFIALGTRPNQLFLTESIDRNLDALMPIYKWFHNVLTVIPADATFSGLAIGLDKDRSFTEFLGRFLQNAGTGIDSIAANVTEINFDDPKIPKYLRDKLFEGLNNNLVETIQNPQGGDVLYFSRNSEGQVKLIQLKTKHLSEDGNLIDFSIDEESEGTQRLINIIPLLFLLSEEAEKVFFLDELDRRLHPLLSKHFVSTALNCRSKNNQLIFTTHDTHLLDLELLRRDEIWFVEKDKYGKSDCYSLAEFKIRPDLKIEKGYLNARFGAIPFFGNPKDLGWFECEDSLSEKAN